MRNKRDEGSGMNASETSEPVVCVCFDEHFAFQGTMAVLSAAWSLPMGVTLRAYIVDTGVTQGTAEKVRRVLGATCVRYFWLTPDLEDLKRLPLPEPTWLNYSTFARLLIPDLLPADVKRFLYLDGDTIVVDDIRRFFSLEMDGAVVMACEDALYTTVGKSASSEVHRELGMDDEDSYFNAGILMFDCLEWRKRGLREKTFDLIMKNGRSFKHADQDALNIALRGEWKAVEQRWNATSFFFNPANGRFPSISENPGIIHFTGPNPGTKNCIHPRRSAFYRIVRKSNWFDSVKYWKWVFGLEIRIIPRIKYHRLKYSIKRLIGRA